MLLVERSPGGRANNAVYGQVIGGLGSTHGGLGLAAKYPINGTAVKFLGAQALLELPHSVALHAGAQHGESRWGAAARVCGRGRA